MLRHVREDTDVCVAGRSDAGAAAHRQARRWRAPMWVVPRHSPHTFPTCLAQKGEVLEPIARCRNGGAALDDPVHVTSLSLQMWFVRGLRLTRVERDARAIGDMLNSGIRSDVLTASFDGRQIASP